MFVLGLARTGLIFTGLQEGAQPGGGAWPHLARARCSIPCDVTLGSSGGSGAAGNSLAARERAAPVLFRESGCLDRAVRWYVFSFFVPLLFLFPSVCCSVKLPLSRPTGFCLFLVILLRTPAGGGAAAWRFCYQKTKQCSCPRKCQWETFRLINQFTLAFVRRGKAGDLVLVKENPF